MTLAERLRQLREQRQLSLDELASKAGISKTYLWELEKDTTGAKKPSADVLLRLAKALSTTIGDLLSQPVVRVKEASGPVPIVPSLQEFCDRMKNMGAPLSDADLRDLAVMKFRGGQPDSADEWHQLYLTLINTVRGKKSS
jgi:transcriptional regulator with XRE-family HTH domain